MANRFMTVEEATVRIGAPYIRMMAAVIRAHPPRPGDKLIFPGVGGCIGSYLEGKEGEDYEAMARGYEQFADKLEADWQAKKPHE